MNVHYGFHKQENQMLKLNEKHLIQTIIKR